MSSLSSYFNSRYITVDKNNNLCLSSKCSSHQRPALVTTSDKKTVVNPSLQKNLLHLQDSLSPDESSLESYAKHPIQSPSNKSSSKMSSSCSLDSLHENKLCSD